MNEKIKVLVIDDSAMFRRAISDTLKEYKDIEVIDTARDSYDARDKIKKLKPDVLTLDIEMPGLDGIEFLKILMSQLPIPTIVISSANERCFEAVNCGAISFVDKPNARNLDSFSEELSNKIREASKAKVYKKKYVKETINQTLSSRGTQNSNIKIISIGASMGGVEAVERVLRKLPKGLPPIVITQHMPPVFTEKYAQRLDKECKIDVFEAKDGTILKNSCAYLAQGGKHMGIIKMGTLFKLEVKNGEKISGHCPSVDYLFSTVAKEAKDSAIGVILTGMGADGAKGLLSIRKSGGYTIGQDKQTCVVYGMPMVAKKIGGVIAEAPLDNIPEIILNRLKK